MLIVDPCSHFFIFFLLPCLKPQNESQPAKLKRKRYYVWTSEQMFDKLNQNKTNLADQHLLTITLIAISGFVKFSEVSRLRCSDLVFSSTYVKTFIEKIKTNIIGKECGFTSQFLVKSVHWNNLNISWPSQKYPKNQRDSFSEA